MKKNLTISSICLCIIGIISTTCLTLIPGIVGTAFLYGGLGIGILGLGCAAGAGKIEKKEYEQSKTKTFEVESYIKTEQPNEKHIEFEKHTNKIKDDNSLTK